MLRVQVIETVDRASAATADRGFYTPEKLGRSRRLTPEGYLVCEGVPIARTGTQLYHASELSELKLKGDEAGVIRVERRADEIFRPDTMASFEGKSITVEHPPEFVNPQNRREHEVGHVQNVRRGADDEDDLLLADLIIKDPLAIQYVNSDLPQLSSGYDAGYEQDGPGRAIQRGLVGNHVALVKRGRAGPRVAVRDHSINEGAFMKTRDSMLNAIDKGKQIVLGMVWEGGMKPRMDTLQDEIKDLVTPFTLGNILHAESPGNIINPGMTWQGDSSKPHFKRITDALQELESAVADAKAAKGAYTRDAAARAPSAFGRLATPAELNQLSDRFYDRAVTPAKGPSSVAEMNAQATKFYADEKKRSGV